MGRTKAADKKGGGGNNTRQQGGFSTDGALSSGGEVEAERAERAREAQSPERLWVRALRAPGGQSPRLPPELSQRLRRLEMRAGHRQELRTQGRKSRVKDTRQSAEAENFSSSSGHIPSPLKSESSTFPLKLQEKCSSAPSSGGKIYIIRYESI